MTLIDVRPKSDGARITFASAARRASVATTRTGKEIAIGLSGAIRSVTIACISRKRFTTY